MIVQRRPRGSLVGAKRVGLTLETAANERLEKVSNHLGVSKSEFAQWLIESVELDNRGIPVGWPDEPERDGELPIDSA